MLCITYRVAQSVRAVCRCSYNAAARVRFLAVEQVVGVRRASACTHYRKRVPVRVVGLPTRRKQIAFGGDTAMQLSVIFSVILIRLNYIFFLQALYLVCVLWNP